ncbi:hypothetical protein LEP1GSC170_0740 [Leptospira interrogans serovar Bataviae str. HAI135]|nr:hypothetical protein LEP1GSC170_0740 [Leptospira interrogans serovar Bataviae str. HAI135]
MDVLLKKCMERKKSLNKPKNPSSVKKSVSKHTSTKRKVSAKKR